VSINDKLITEVGDMGMNDEYFASPLQEFRSKKEERKKKNFLFPVPCSLFTLI
jgi:hypothetical protein